MARNTNPKELVDTVSERNPVAPESTAGGEGANAPMAYVQMIRDPEMHPEPHAAQVHPDEVENYRSGGWEIEHADGSTKN